MGTLYISLIVWIICVIIAHICCYIDWKENCKEGNTLYDMYTYYEEPAIVLMWCPIINFIPIIYISICIFYRVIKGIRIR